MESYSKEKMKLFQQFTYFTKCDQSLPRPHLQTTLQPAHDQSQSSKSYKYPFEGTAQEWPREDTPCPRSGAMAERRYSTSKSGPETMRRYPKSKVGSSAVLCWSSCEEILHVQGKRNPSKTVGAEGGHQRADRLKPQSQKTSQSDHMDHSLV